MPDKRAITRFFLGYNIIGGVRKGLAEGTQNSLEHQTNNQLRSTEGSILWCEVRRGEERQKG